VASNIAIGIEVSTADLEAKLALAQASLRQFSAATRDLANQAVAGGGAVQSGLLPQLEASATSAAKARLSVSTLRGEIAATGGAVSTAALPFATLTREMRALGTELSRGEFLRAGGTIALLGEHMLELGPATLGAIAATAAFAGGLVYLALEATRAQKALDDIQGSMILVGRGAQFSSDAASGAMAQLANEFNISRSAAAQLAVEFAKIPVASDAARSELAPLALALASVSGETPAKAAEQLARAFAGGASSALQFGDAIRLFTPEQKLALEDAGKHNDVLRAQAILEAALNARLGDQIQYLKDIVTQEQRVSEEMAKGLVGLPVSSAGIGAPTRPAGGAQPNQDALQALDVATRYRGVQDDISRIKGDIAILDRAIATTEAGPLLDAEVSARAQAQKQLQALQAQGGASILEQDRTQLAQELALSTAGHAEQEAQAAAFWQRVLATQKLSAKDREAVERELAVAQKQIKADLLAYNLQTIGQDEKTNAAYFATQEAQIRADFAEKKTNADEEYGLLVDLEAKKTKAVVASLQERYDFLKGDAARQSAVGSEIFVAEQTHVQALIKLYEQYFSQKQKLENQDVSGWKTAINEILSAEQSFISSVFSGRQTLSQSLLKLSSNLVEKELADDLKYITTKALYGLLGLANDEKIATGGLLVHAIMQQKETAATAAGVAQRTALENTANTTFLGRIATKVGQWLFGETSMTAATTAGGTQREATYTAEAIASHAASVALAFSQIQIEASIAAAAAFADSAETGPEGLLAAPGAATAAYTFVMGYATGLGGGIPGLAEGAWTIPGNMLAMLHPGEAVVPQPFAQGLRDSGGGGAGLTFAPTIISPSAKAMQQMLLDPTSGLTKAFRRWVRNASSDLRAALPTR